MSLDKDLINQLVKVTSRAAINCYQFLGKENKTIVDKAATDSMRNDLNNLEINGEVVIGEGELDEAPMLYIGEKLGKGNGPYLDIAVDCNRFRWCSEVYVWCIVSAISWSAIVLASGTGRMEIFALQ